MGKDKEGKYHPPKGKPSGTGKEEGVGLTPPFTGSPEQYIEMAEKYTEGDNEMPANVKVRHPNRNVNKGADRKPEKSEHRSGTKGSNETLNDDRTTAVPEELPGVLTKEIFQHLAGFKSEHCVSLYMPTHRSGIEVNEQEDTLLFKNALQEVAGSLKSKGVEQSTIQRILEPGYQLLGDYTFWRYVQQGLAVFMADGFFRYIRMPDTPPNELMINSSFLLKPLVNAMTVKEYFYLLVVSKKQCKLYKADAFGMSKVEIDELPNGVDDVVHLEENDDQKLFRTEASHAGRGASFHGQGAGKPDEKENIAIYLEEVDDTIWEQVLNKENVPLLLAGVEYLLPIYRSVTDYNFIWPEVITGSHEHDDLVSLHAIARRVMEPHYRERTKKALATYGNQSATALTSTIADDIVPAAHYGRVAHLFVIRGEHIWGTFNEAENILEIHDSRQDGDECLIDKAVIKTILNGGDVHFVSREDMPGETNIAALMRYSVEPNE